MSDPYYHTDTCRKARTFIPGLYRAWAIKRDAWDKIFEILEKVPDPQEESFKIGNMFIARHMDFKELWDGSPVRQFWVVCDMRFEEPKALLSTNFYTSAVLFAFALDAYQGNIARAVRGLSEFLEYRDWHLDKHE